MNDSARRTLQAAGTWASPVATVACAIAAGQAGIDPLATVLIVATGALGFASGWLLCRLFAERRKTPHNRLCREILAKLGELPRGERWSYIEKQIEHEKVDGRTDFSNAIRSLIEQDCIRDIEIRDHMDGGYNVYAGPHLGVTGKRYVDD